jgi:bisphosphoglycerate-independent phosphoglycerate mutase (AlkP superfamily)
MKESDWKIFKKIKEHALEKFCADFLADVSEIVGRNNQSAHERYLDLYEAVSKKDKELGRIFDWHSRSKATMQLLIIRKHGLAEERLLKELSDEFFEITDPKRLL